MPTNILAEAFLSFIGIGISPPTPSWGVMAEEGYRALQSYPHLTLFPAFFISATMMAFTFIGDYLRDRLDPMLRGR
jgi:oligopeptide transport system permease protein